MTKFYVATFRPEQYKILDIVPEVEDNNKDNESDHDDELAGKN